MTRDLRTKGVKAMNEHYGTLQEGTEYFRGSMNSDPWDCANNNQRTKALITATRSIDRLNYASQRASADQALAFPREVGNGETPADIINATYELSRALLDGVDDQLEFENLAMTSQNIGGVRTTYKRDGSDDHIICGIPDIKAWRLILPYLRDNNEINIMRS
jgi:hypothetical protein